MRSVSRACFVLVSVIFFSGCLITPHYYSAKTLAPGKKSFTFAANSIVIDSYVNGINVKKESVTISPQLGLNYGLQYRFEIGAQLFLPALLEGRLRWQINPDSFTYFDASLDGTYGFYLSHLDYFKYGGTISKDIGIFTLYAYYCKNSVMNVDNEDDDSLNGLINAIITHYFDISSDVGFGFEIDLPHNTKLCPELNYQIYNNHFEEGLFSIGAALKHHF